MPEKYDDRYPVKESDSEELEAYKVWVERQGSPRFQRANPKPTFNKESWLTDLTYSIPVSDLSSRTKTNLYKITQYYGIDWDDVALAIPVQYTESKIEGFRARSRSGYPVSPGEVYRKSYMIEGTTPKGSEVIYFRKEGQHPASGQSYIYVNGVKYLVSEFVQDPTTRWQGHILPEETEIYTQKKFEESPPKKRTPSSYKDTRLPEPEEIYIDTALSTLDWT